MTAIDNKMAYVRWFSDLTLQDVPSVGGKNASLGEMVRELTKAEIRVPNGFAVTVAAYRAFLSQGGPEERIRHMLDGLNTQDVEDLQSRAIRVRHAIIATPFPADLNAYLRGTALSRM